MIVSVCICTFRRPALLEALLGAIDAQRLSDTNCRIEVVVVDNDPAHSARPVLQAWQSAKQVELQFFHAPEPNIAAARNMAIAHARGALLAFIDDDETPANDWLECLMQARQRWDADAVLGPVLPRYLPQTPAWIISGGYFERPRFPSGTAIDERNARTGNVLLRRACLAPLEGPFDRAFGRTGGEDSIFFRDLLARRCKLIWCDEAPVSEEVPLDRATSAWLLRRSFRVGQTWIRAELYRKAPAQRLLRGFYLGLRAFFQLWISLLLSLVSVPLSRIRAFEWLRKAASQMGKLTGMTRLQFNEYGGGA